MKIAFVILTWNSEKYIKDCIESILNFNKIKAEIYITDNGSKDKSVSILKEYSKNNNVTVTYLKDNMGTTISRNISLKKIKNVDFICILDSDTIINEKAITYMCDYLKNNPNVGIVGPKMFNAANEPQISYRKFPNWRLKLLKACPIKKISKMGEAIEKYDLDGRTELSCDYLISACWVIPFNIFKKIGYFDEKIFYAPEDVEYCMRVREHGYDVVYLDKPSIIHYYQRISKKKFFSKVNMSHILGLKYVFKKYHKFLKKYRKSEI